MKLSTVLQTLQLTTAAIVAYADGDLVDFGRFLHRDQVSVERLRQSSAKSSKVLIVEEEMEQAAVLAAEVASRLGGKTGKKGFQVIAGKSSATESSMPYLGNFEAVKSAKTSKVLRTRINNQSSKATGYLSYAYEEPSILPKSSKSIEYMSYDYFAGSFADIGSMKFELSDEEESFFSPPTMIPDSLDDVFEELKEEEETGEEWVEGEQIDEEVSQVEDVDTGLNSFGRLVFEYLSQCSGADLDVDSCLASSTIYYLTSFDISEDDTVLSNSTRALSPVPIRGNGRSRFLQSLNEDECAAPEIEATFLSYIISSSRAQCEGIGKNVTDDALRSTVAAFTTIFDSQSCWASLCNESSNPSDLFFKILFAEAARCADIDTSVIPECVLGHVFDLIFASDDPQVKRVRRTLQKSSSCDQPSENELGLFVTFLLTEAEQTCTAINADFDAELDQTFDALIKIFGASQCWGVEECEDDMFYYDDDWMTPVVQMDGTRCELETVNASSTKAIDLSYYYLLETASSSEDIAASSILTIERNLVTHACSSERRRLEDALSEIIAVDSKPLDTISTEYVCSPKASGAQACYVIEGTLTILVPSSQSSARDDELKEFIYASELRDVFGSMNLTEDPNAISVEYFGRDTSYLTSSNTAAASSGSQENSGAISSIAIGIGSALVVVGALIASIKKGQVNDDPIHPNEKSVNDEQTSDLTYSTSLDDRSEVSSISPTNRYFPERAAMTKHFVLAEEEEANWARLGIISHTKSQLEVYEEILEEQSI